jgi:hypothetical protein
MSYRVPRPHRQLLAAFLVGLAACGDSCSTGITPADAVPFQACAQDTDCVMVSSSCTDCSSPIAINQSQSQAFQGFRGCWPDPNGADSQCPGTGGFGGGCGNTLCARNRCVVSSGCFGGATAAGTIGGGFTASAGTNGTFTTATSTSFAATTSTGGGRFSICGGCGSDSDCASGYCDFTLTTTNRGFCDSLSFCVDSACAPFPCDANTGLCSCGDGSSTLGTSGSGGSTGGSTADSSSGMATAGSGTSGTATAGSSGSDSGTTGGSGSSGASGSGGETDGGLRDAG